jgi:hypothetical protein
MRLASLASKIAIMVFGIVVGAVTTWAFVSRPAPPASISVSMSAETPIPEPTSPPPKGSSAELGAKLLQRVGRNLIADDRARGWQDGPIEFYGAPRPYGDTLCRVAVYTVAPKIIRGAILEKEKWDDDLKVETRYGLWKRPSAAGGDRDKACAAFRDFRHLITEGSLLSVGRATYAMDTILDQAKSGKAGFKMSCTIMSLSLGKPVSCDPLAILRALSLQDIYHAETTSEAKNDRSSVFRDQVLVAGDKITKILKMKTFMTTINIEDEQHFGKQRVDEADVRSVEIVIEELC